MTYERTPGVREKLQRQDSNHVGRAPSGSSRSKNTGLATAAEPPLRAPAPEVSETDLVEQALAEALRKEAARQDSRTDVLLALTRELEARRLARSAPNVVALGTRKRGER